MTINAARLRQWLHQPTTVAGLAALAGDVALVLGRAADWRVELPLALGSLVAMVLPDNSVASSLSIRTLRDVLDAIETRDPVRIATAVNDGQALLTAVAGRA